MIAVNFFNYYDSKMVNKYLTKGALTLNNEGSKNLFPKWIFKTFFFYRDSVIDVKDKI